MNYPIIFQILARVAGIEAVLLLLPMGIALYCGEEIDGFLVASVTALLVSLLFFRIRPKNTALYAREGFASVTLSWILLSIIGAIPFTVGGSLTYTDALFETVSGLTTTGASILPNGPEELGKGLLFWRSLTQWIGGMGVLIFMMAVVPLAEEYSMHIMRAEITGPVTGKLVPHMRKTSIWLYLIYVALTGIEVILLKLGGVSLYDALVHAFGTAGTGGFSNYNLNVAQFNSAYIEMIVGVFMILFGINFHLYYLILMKKIHSVLRNEELWWYLGIILFATVSIMLNIYHLYGNLPVSLRHAFFQVSGIITTTAYVTADFTLWPMYSQCLLFLLMFCGACAGSTGGGIKLARVIILTKVAVGQIRRLLRPRSFEQVRLNGTIIDKEVIRNTLVYWYIYFFIAGIFCLLLSFENFDLVTTVTSAIACLSNTGMGFGGLIGPYGSFAEFSNMGKLILSFGMLLGRLEFYPVLLSFAACLPRRK